MKLTRDNLEHVTNEAHAWHMHQLERYGNKPNQVQRTILKALMQMFSDMAVGSVVGRFPWPLATGLGKTTAIIAYHRTLEALKVEGVSTATAASQVEALCRLYRDMQAAGVPKEKIGLLHSKKYDHVRPDLWKANSAEYASEPATSDNGTRPYVLVTQERVKDKDKYREYFYFDGKPRSFLTWDESILATDYWKLTLNSIKGATATLMGLSQDEPELAGMYQGFKRQSEFLLRELKLATVRRKTRHCTPPTVPLETIEEWKALASESRFRGLLHQGTRPCLPFFNQSLRVYPLKESGGLVWYTPAIPSEDEIPSMIILDASFPIRELEKADTTLKRVNETVKAFVDGEVSFTDAKRYDSLIIHQWCRHSGRDAMHKDFFGVKNETAADHRSEWLAQRMAEQSVARRTAKVAATLPREEALLFFVFKPEQMGQDEYRRVLEAKLQREGIDLTATVPVMEYDHEGKPAIVNKPRVNILTFGQETSLNDFSHVQNVFLVGMLHRDELDVLGQYVAQCDGGKHENLEQQQAQRLVQSEIIHTIYQAISRGSCRVTENGQARPMKAWVIHYSKAIREPLETVIPGVQWVDDWTQDNEAEISKKLSKPIDPLALKLREHLESMLPEMFPMLCRDVKVESGLSDVSRQVWRRIAAEATEGTPFKVEAKSQSFILDTNLVAGPTLPG